MNHISKRVMLLIILIMSTFGAVTAQEEDTLGDAEAYRAFYEGIPFSRAEDGGFVLGESDAPITIVEFADFLCPHCQTYVEVSHEFVEKYVATGEAKFEYRLFPIVDPTLSPLAAQVAECANAQEEGLFFPVHDYLYALAEARQVTADVPSTVSDTFGLDIDVMNDCLVTATQYVTDLDLGQSIGVSGTPASRARLSSGELGYIVVDGQIFDRGGVPIELLDIVMSAEDFESVVALPESLLTHLVESSESCDADPCWNGLVPGVTEWETVTSFITEQPTYSDIQLLSPQDETSAIRGISWFGLGAQTSNPNQAVTLDGEILDFIIITEISPYTVGEVFDVKGEPTFAAANVLSPEFSIVDMFYPDRSIVVQVLVEASVGEFSSESQIIGAQYLSETTMGDFLDNNPLPEWTGFEGFEDYIVGQ